jgi:hypothetical protein
MPFSFLFGLLLWPEPEKKKILSLPDDEASQRARRVKKGKKINQCD